jgi:hypothetical protein
MVKLQLPKVDLGVVEFGVPRNVDAMRLWDIRAALGLAP